MLSLIIKRMLHQISSKQSCTGHVLLIFCMLAQMNKLPRSFYLNPDVVDLAKSLIGKRLVSNIGDELTSGIISETEAYAGVSDKASHAFGGRRTARTEIMYSIGGTAYVYLCYGIHHLFNIVTNRESIPHAILIRGIIPEKGIETMKHRRKTDKMKILTAGPGTVSQALGIKTKHTGIDLLGDEIWIEETDIQISEEQILVTPRIGIDYAVEDALLPYRFLLKQVKVGKQVRRFDHA